MIRAGFWVADGAIRLYQVAVRPLLPSSCRFSPSCSEYARQALTIHGLARGTLLAIRRICRCHPFNAGGFDPPPFPGDEHGPRR